MYRFLVLLAVAATAFVARAGDDQAKGDLTARRSVPATGDDQAKKDLESMQGVWKVVELTEKGQKLPEKDLTPVEVVIKGDKMALHDAGEFREEITLKLGAAAKFSTVDFVYSKGKNKGKTERGIYVIDGDTLKICMNEAKDGPRPTAFASTKDNSCSVAVLMRVKK